MKLLVSAEGVQFETMNEPYEPLFFSLAIFDVARRVKVSETFHFDFNRDSFRKDLSKVPQATYLLTHNNHAFS